MRSCVNIFKVSPMHTFFGSNNCFYSTPNLVRTECKTATGSRQADKSRPIIKRPSHQGVSEPEVTHRPDDGGSTDIWNAGKLIPVYTALQSRTKPSSYSPPCEPQIIQDYAKSSNALRKSSDILSPYTKSDHKWNTSLSVYPKEHQMLGTKLGRFITNFIHTNFIRLVKQRGVLAASITWKRIQMARAMEECWTLVVQGHIHFSFP
jgi:hypothetical protein